MLGIESDQVPVHMISMTHGVQHFFGKIFPPLIPLIAVDLQLPLWKLGLVVSLWSIANGLSQTPMGYLSDRTDRRFLLPGGVAMVGVGYLIVAAAMMFGTRVPALSIAGVEWSGTLLVVTAGMIVAGIGKSATHPTGYPLLTANVGEGKKGRALGEWGSASKIGDAVGPAFVAISLLLLPWYGVFAAVAVLSFGYSVLLFGYMSRSVIKTVPDTHDGDDGGEGDADGYWFSVGLVLLAVIAAGFASRGINTYLPTYISEVYAFSFSLLGVTFQPESVSSMYFSAMLLSGAVMMLFIGKIVDSYDARSIMAALYLGATLSLVALAFVPLTPLTLLIVSVVMGGTLFAANPARDAIISRVAPEAREGRIFGYFWTLLLLVSSAFPVLIGYLSDLVGIRQGFTYLAIGPLLALLPLLLLRWKRDGDTV